VDPVRLWAGVPKYFIVVANLPVEEIPAVYDNLMRTAMGRTNNDEERSRDLVQQAFVKALKCTYDKSKASLNTWMHYVLFSVIADSRKTHKVRLNDFAVSLDEHITDDKRSKFEEVDYEDMVNKVTSRLPKKMRACLDDALAGNKMRTSAKNLGVSRATIAIRRRELREWFRPHVENK
jgi:RNA polymerase sigma factor (sigma-70 family)